MPNFKDVLLKNSFCLKSAQKIQLAVSKLCLTSFCAKNYLLPNYRHVLLKNAFCMKSAQKIQLALWKLCLTSFCAKNYLLPNYRHVLLKKCFLHEICSRNTTRCLENCIWLHFVLKTTFCQILSMSCFKNAFCMKSAQKIQLAVWKLCLTSFWVENYLLPNYKHVLLKNAFCMKSAQGVQLAVENCVWLHIVLKTIFCQILRMSC